MIKYELFDNKATALGLHPPERQNSSRKIFMLL